MRAHQAALQAIADANGGTRSMQGTSQASAVMAGVAALAQDLALQTLGRRDEALSVLDASAAAISRVRPRTNTEMNTLHRVSVAYQRDGEWVLLDLQDVVLHVMLPRVREFYALERLWEGGAAA